MKKVYGKCIKPLLLLMILALSFVIAGCDSYPEGTLSLYDNDVTEYAHSDNGLGFLVPSDWIVVGEDETSVTFYNAEGTLSMYVRSELAGYGYYSSEDLLDIAAQISLNALPYEGRVLLRDTLSGLSVGDAKTAQRIIGKGKLTEDGNFAVSDILLVSPYASVRYYMVTISTVEAYEENVQVIEEVYKSMYMTKNEDEMYELLDDYSEAYQAEKQIRDAEVEE